MPVGLNSSNSGINHHWRCSRYSEVNTTPFKDGVWINYDTLELTDKCRPNSVFSRLTECDKWETSKQNNLYTQSYEEEKQAWENGSHNNSQNNNPRWFSEVWNSSWVFMVFYKYPLLHVPNGCGFLPFYLTEDWWRL